jgi:CheY-like chemotaxis protein
MPVNAEPYGTSVLFIDENDTDRAFYIEGLTRCSADYQILHATDGQSERDLYRSRRFDCVVLELALPDRSGFALLIDLLPIPSRPNIAVIILTRRAYRGMWELAKQNGAYACLVKQHTSGEDLDKYIRCAVAYVGLLPKEERHRPI